MIKKITILVVSALVFAGCTHNRFDRVEKTPAEYSIMRLTASWHLLNTALYPFCEELWRTRSQSLCSVAARMGWME